MKLKTPLLLSILTSGLLLAGCASQGEFRQSSGSQVSLAGNNYKILKTGVKGTSTGFKLLGLIPIVPPNMADAKQSLYASCGESLTGRSVALANETEDRSSVYLILFSLPRYTITADVVEFNGGTTPNKAP